MSYTTTVPSFYAAEGIRSRLEGALNQMGLSDGPIDGAKLALADQFHAGGLDATKEVAQALRVQEGSHVLDVGSGFGGPARFLSKTYGCRVTGIDLTPDYVEIAEYLTDRTGQAGLVSFQCADALDLPFDDQEFDSAMTQHVGMNIEDKERFYSEIFRVLKPGGDLAIYDIVLAGDEAPAYPQPWAANPSSSFAVQPDVIREALRAAGFEDISSEDKTPLASNAFVQLRRLIESGEAPPLTIASLLGGRSKDAMQNLAEALRDGRLRAELFVAHKPLLA